MSNFDKELDEMRVEIHFKENSVPSIHAGLLTAEAKAKLSALLRRVELGASEQPTPQEEVGGKQVDKLSEAFSYKPPVSMPFESRHIQVFTDWEKTEGTFSNSLLATKADEVKQLAYSIEYVFTPEKRHAGRKPNDPAMMSVHLHALVTDLASNNPEATKDSANPPGTNPINTEVSNGSV